MKKIGLLVAACAFCTVLSAQLKKQVITVEAFTYSSGVSASICEQVRNRVMSSLSATGRLELVDISTNKNFANEAERRKQESAMNDAGRVKDMSTLNSNFLLGGSVESITHSTAYTKNGTLYQCKINYTLKFLDPSNGTVTASRSYVASGSSGNGKDAAQNDAINSSGGLSSFVQEFFPVRGKILALEEASSKGDKAKTVFINLGSDYGISKGQKFDVFKIIDVAGEKSEKLIGTITLKQVMSASRSVCDVNKGADVILQGLSGGETLTIKSRATRTFLNF